MPANNTNIPPYSAADLLRYATGGMTASEMHTLEKAALEDPFLAEALEGFMDVAATQPKAVIQKNIDRLPPKITKKEELKVIPLWRKRMVQMAAAAAVVLGIGWWSVSFLTKNSEQDNSDLATVKSQPSNTVLEDNTSAPTTEPDGNIASNKQANQIDSAPEIYASLEKPKKTFSTQSAPVQSLPAAPASSPMADSAISNFEVAKNEEVVNILENKASGILTKEADTVVGNSMKDYAFAKRSAASSASVSKISLAQHYIFRGRVTDSKNNPLTYTNVSIEGGEVGTYTDASGRFNLISNDSTLTVRTKSIGFESQVFTLKPVTRETQMVMREDEKLKESIATTVQTRQERVYDYRPTIVETDSIEGNLARPSISLTDYNLYLANNNRLSELQQLSGRQVQLSFEVDKKGNVTNIAVEQSSGKALDDEAIRLLKEGPKWNIKKGKKGKITVKF